MIWWLCICLSPAGSIREQRQSRYANSFTTPIATDLRCFRRRLTSRRLGSPRRAEVRLRLRTSCTMCMGPGSGGVRACSHGSRSSAEEMAGRPMDCDWTRTKNVRGHGQVPVADTVTKQRRGRDVAGGRGVRGSFPCLVGDANADCKEDVFVREKRRKVRGATCMDEGTLG